MVAIGITSTTVLAGTGIQLILVLKSSAVLVRILTQLLKIALMVMAWTSVEMAASGIMKTITLVAIGTQKSLSQLFNVVHAGAEIQISAQTTWK